jgi:hypothetical protein
VKILGFILLIGFAFQVNSQQNLSEWYSLEKEHSVFFGSVVTDSCYYSSGIAINPNNQEWGQTFAKIAFNGDLIDTSFFFSDTTSINSFGAELISTYNNDLVIVASTGDYFILYRYSPDEDTIYSYHLDTTYFYHQFWSGQAGDITQIVADSSIYFSGQLQDTTTGKLHIGLFHCDKWGELIEFNSIPVEQGYFSWLSGDVADLGDGLLFNTVIYLFNTEDTLSRQRTRFIKTDYNLDTLWMWTDWSHKHWVMNSGTIVDSNNDIIVGGQSGILSQLGPDIVFRPTIVKYSSSFETVWDIHLNVGHENHSFCSDIIEHSEGIYVATGERRTDSVKQGWIIKFDGSGDVLWDSYYSFVDPPYIGIPENVLYDIQPTLDGGYLMSGSSWDPGMSSKFGWLLKVDSMGCLIPGCQEVGNLENNDLILFEVYPNPTSNNLFVHSPGTPEGSNFVVYDLNGKILMQWGSMQVDNTYILDVSTLEMGTYVLTLELNGKLLSSQKFSIVR